MNEISKVFSQYPFPILVFVVQSSNGLGYPSSYSSFFVCLLFIYVEYFFVDRYDPKIFKELFTINSVYVDSYLVLSQQQLQSYN